MVALLAKKRKQRKPSNFGAKLRGLREAAGLTQKALGDLVELPYQNIARFERGAVEPTWPTVIAIAGALGTTPDAFLDTTDTPGD